MWWLLGKCHVRQLPPSPPIPTTEAIQTASSKDILLPLLLLVCTAAHLVPQSPMMTLHCTKMVALYRRWCQLTHTPKKAPLNPATCTMGTAALHRRHLLRSRLATAREEPHPSSTLAGQPPRPLAQTLSTFLPGSGIVVLVCECVSTPVVSYSASCTFATFGFLKLRKRLS